MMDAYFEYFNCNILEMFTSAAFFDDAGCVLVVHADFDRLVSDKMHKRLKAVSDSE